MCNRNHDFLKSPAEGLEYIKDGIITMNGEIQSFTAWFEEVQKEWTTGLYFQTTSYGVRRSGPKVNEMWRS